MTQELRRRLNGIGLISFCKTTGASGPSCRDASRASATERVTSWEVGREAKEFARAVCQSNGGRQSRSLLTDSPKEPSKGKIPTDYMR